MNEEKEVEKILEKINERMLDINGDIKPAEEILKELFSDDEDPDKRRYAEG